MCFCQCDFVLHQLLSHLCTVITDCRIILAHYTEKTHHIQVFRYSKPVKFSGDEEFNFKSSDGDLAL